MSPDSTVAAECAEQIVDDHYIQMSGTSMATPICAGVIALMLEANPDLSPNDVKSILQMTGDPAVGSGWAILTQGVLSRWRCARRKIARPPLQRTGSDGCKWGGSGFIHSGKRCDCKLGRQFTVGDVSTAS
ncbi:S8 family serine peptidase [Salinicoccus roseus]|uniref:S8 family serine peptidase n=1 Tax=Salinicoccus roseus TaxID=45670 RepID=UPI001EF4A750|nr:S8 family serine peptidase [Salinicoccus roseus]MCG7332476.1 S8 family serine peptidase [Salinicoccus roseus]